jgi:hypothetical protein
MLRRGKNVPTDVGSTWKMRRTHRGSGGNVNELLAHTDGLPSLWRTLGAGQLHKTIRSQNTINVRRNTMR